jgi:hypothetical protein
VASSLRSVMDSLQKWRKSNFKSVPKEIERKRAELENLRNLTDEASIAARVGLLVWLMW